MNSLMHGNQSLTCCAQHCHGKAKSHRPWRLHESILSLGDAAPCYTTTHAQSYCGRSADGRPLVFYLRDPCFPSQHHTCLDLSDNITPQQCPLLSHTKDVHRPKHVTLRADPKAENWARFCCGRAVRELTNPQAPAECWTPYRLEQPPPVTDGRTQLAGGRPTQWHQHNILTGEQRQTAGPGKPVRTTRDKLLWPARQWETDCCALRLY